LEYWRIGLALLHHSITPASLPIEDNEAEIFTPCGSVSRVAVTTIPRLSSKRISANRGVEFFVTRFDGESHDGLIPVIGE
jgi:hypothetical protein